MAAFFLFKFSGGLGSMSKPQAAIQIELEDRDPTLLLEAVREFGKPEDLRSEAEITRIKKKGTSST